MARKLYGYTSYAANPDKQLEKAIDSMPSFMHPEIEYIQTWDDLVHAAASEIIVAEGGGVEPPWTRAQFARAKAYLSKIETIARTKS